MSTKVCHLTSAHTPEDIRIFVKECSTLAKAGFDVHLVATGNVPNYSKNNVNIHLVPKRKGGRFDRMYHSVNDVLNKALEIDAEIYHFHDPELLRIALKLKAKGKKVIFDSHEDLPRQIMGKYWIPKLFRSLVSNAFEFYENYVVSKIDGVVAATPIIRDRFLKVNSNVVDVNNFPLLGEFSEEPDFSHPKKEQVCYVGGLAEVRGISYLVKSMVHLPNLRLKLGGFFSPESYHDVIKSLPGYDKVDFLGMLNREQVKNLLASSKVGLVTLLPTPNILDSQPIKLFEYMAAGLPVVASDFPLWRKIIDDAECGICVDPHNPTQIADAIKKITTNPDLARKMGESGRNMVVEKYNWESQEPVLIEFYNKILSA
ncbi:MAG TPA: glycosyltransferase family 4 protein [Bacteroidia bacterium]